MKRLVLVAALLVCASVSMAATGTVTEAAVTLSGITKVTVDWTCGANGDVEQTLATRAGTIRRVTFDPDATTPPVNLYDVTLSDSAGIDLLQGLGANLASNAASSVVPLETAGDGASITSGAAVVFCDRLALSITNAGVSKVGRIILHLR